MIAHNANLLIRDTQKAAICLQLPETCQSAIHPIRDLAGHLAEVIFRVLHSRPERQERANNRHSITLRIAPRPFHLLWAFPGSGRALTFGKPDRAHMQCE